MPSLRAFGRRWNIASDDFVFPSITEAIVRFGWVFITGVIFALHNPLNCPSLVWLAYVGVLILINLVSTSICIATAVVSARGSILDTTVRKHVTTLIYIRVPVLVVELMWTAVSTAYVFRVFGAEDFCYFIYGMRITVILEWVLMVSVIIGVIAVFNPDGAHRVDSVMVERSYWRQRLCLCKVGQDVEMRGAIDDIASLMASFFVGHDFVLSDIVSGLLLVVHSPHTVMSTTGVLEDTPDMPDWMVLPDNMDKVKRFFDFSIAVYGWPSYMFNNCACGPWYQLCRTLQCCHPCRCGDVRVVEDNCCTCHTSAFVLESGLNQTELFFVSFRNRLYQTPFVVLTDHQTKSIVITIRGSASLMDLITDLSLNSERFSVDVDTDPILRADPALDDGEVRVHRGMLRGARYVYNTLKGHKVLDDLYMLNPGYDLVVCGHSLGAGVASLLTLLLKQQYPDIRCYSYSPPGCVISKHGLHEMENHVLSVIVGDDLVPRISYQSLYRLKNNIDRELQFTTKAKYEIIIKGIFKLFFPETWNLHDDNAGLIDAESTRDCRRLIEDGQQPTYGSSDSSETTSTNHVVDDNSENAVLDDSFRVQLYPPGRLAHLNAREEDAVELRWIEPSFLSDIQLTGAIFADHFPHRMKKVLKRFTNNGSSEPSSVVSSVISV
uniref:sn-1-specific diacylglycerol lipase n=1 Tax=Panagrellus redivivus TaxID=6233 RepID=A0A7E4UUQ0_PANRE